MSNKILLFYVTTERLKIPVYAESVNFDDMTLTGAIIVLERLLKMHGEDSKLTYDGNNDGMLCNYDVNVYRPETDHEYNRRIKRESEMRENRKNLYLQLKAEFESET